MSNHTEQTSEPSQGGYFTVFHCCWFVMIPGTVGLLIEIPTERRHGFAIGVTAALLGILTTLVAEQVLLLLLDWLDRRKRPVDN